MLVFFDDYVKVTQESVTCELTGNRNTKDGQNYGSFSQKVNFFSFLCIRYEKLNNYGRINRIGRQMPVL